MPREKLILICQSGGEFVTNDDGSLTYTGGDAHALNINPETQFDDLKLKLAKMCNVDYDSLAIKYFLPGNKKLLITLANDKELRRMYDFHEDSVTAEVFVIGQEGFDRRSLYEHTTRVRKIKPAETVTPVSSKAAKATVSSKVAKATVSSKVAKATASWKVAKRTAAWKVAKAKAKFSSRVAAATPVVLGLTTTPIKDFPEAANKRPLFSPDTVKAINAMSKKRTRKATTTESSPIDAVAEDPSAAMITPSDDVVTDQATSDSSILFDVNTTPADTVKKRRRTASWKFGARGPSIIAVSDDTEETTDDSSQSGDDSSHDTDTDTDMETGDVEKQLAQLNVVHVNGARRRKTTARRSIIRKKSAHKHIFDSEADVVEYEEEQSLYDGFDSEDGSPTTMIASWKRAITVVGQEFESVAEFRDALQKYAIAHRFGYKLKKNDSNRARAVCIVEGCSWKIFASWVPSEEAFVIKKMNKSHTCGGESWKGAHPSRSWLVNIIKSRLKESPHCKPKDIRNSISRDFGVKLNYGKVRRGLEGAKEQLLGNHRDSYDQLPWFCDKIVESNPGSLVKFFVGDDNKFHRLFVSFQASVRGFLNGCRPILFLDSISIKSKYHETMLMATAIDANDEFFPVSFGVVDVENDDTWHWFLEQLKSAISTSRTITFISDNEKRLMKSVLEVFENAHHGYSIYHLGENLKQNLKGPFYGDERSSLIGSLVTAAHSARLDGHRKFTEQVKMISPKAYDWLMSVEPEYWTNALFKGEMHHCQVTVNAAELFIDWIEELRELPITQKLEALKHKMMELMHARQVASNSWLAKLTPSKEQTLLEENLRACDLRVIFSSDTLFEVHGDSIHVVDINKQECSCAKWKFTGLPCSHAVAVFNRTGRNAYDYCSKWFSVDNYRQTYSECINPILAISTPSDGKNAASDEPEVLPPTPLPEHKEKSNKPQKELKRVMTCSKCKGVGHNKTGCKANK